MSTRMISSPVQLTEADWLEVYYGLDFMASELERLEESDTEEDDNGWGEAAKYLRGIMEKIGVEGRDAYRGGTSGIATVHRTPHSALLERLGGDALNNN